MPNADTSGRTVGERIGAFVAARSNAFVVENFGTRAYFSMMRIAGAMVGNSSSGIIEAASFGLPVVNVGNRQGGRIRGANVVDVPCERAEIGAAIARVLAPEFRDSIAGHSNPYGTGQAAETIVEVLRSVPLDDRLTIKHFVDRYDSPALAVAENARS